MNIKSVADLTAKYNIQLYSLSLLYHIAGVEFSIPQQFSADIGRKVRQVMLKFNHPVVDNCGDRNNCIDGMGREDWDEFVKYMLSIRIKNVVERKYYVPEFATAVIVDPIAYDAGGVIVPQTIQLPIFLVSGLTDRWRLKLWEGIDKDKMAVPHVARIEKGDLNVQIVEEAEKLFSSLNGGGKR